MTLTRKNTLKLVLALLLVVIGIPLADMALGADAKGATPAQSSAVAKADRKPIKSTPLRMKTQSGKVVKVKPFDVFDQTITQRRGPAPWTIRPVPNRSCGYLNPYTGNMGACLLERGGLSGPNPTQFDRRVISCAGQGAIAAAAAALVGPAGAPVIVAGVATVASCAWAHVSE